MYVANMLGAKFSVATVLPCAKDLVEERVRTAGLESQCASIRCTDLTVVETEEIRDAAREALYKASKLAIEEDGAEAICLGCAGMGGLDDELEERLPVPVVDSVAAATVQTAGLVRLGKTTSKVMTYKPPEPKDPEIYQFGDSPEATADDVMSILILNDARPGPVSATDPVPVERAWSGNDHELSGEGAFHHRLVCFGGLVKIVRPRHLDRDVVRCH